MKSTTGKINDEALVQAVKLSDRYVTDRCLPDKALDLIDEACSRLRLEPTLYLQKSMNCVAECLS